MNKISIILALLFSIKYTVYSQNIIERIDRFTSEKTTFSEVLKYEDGSPMSISKCDGYIYISQNGKYYKRVINEQYGINIKWFGAKGDADENDIGTDDTQSIENAIKILSQIYTKKPLSGGAVSSGFTLFFPSGKYIIDKTFKLPSGISIKGQSLTGTIIHAKTPKYIFTNIQGFADNKIDIITTHNITIESLTLQQGGVELQNAVSSSIKNIRIMNLFGKNTDTGISIKQSVSLKISDIKIFGSSGIGILYEDSAGTGPSTTTTFDNIWISHCKIAMLIDGKEGGSHGILTSKIYNSIFEYNDEGIILQGNIDSFAFRDSHFEQNKKFDIKINGLFNGNLQNLWTDIGKIIVTSEISDKSKIYLQNVKIPVDNNKNNENILKKSENNN